EYRKGLLLWQEEINAAGGLLGRRVELRFKDDGSEAVRAGEAYAELIRDGAQVLIGPYGSAATLTAAAEAERARRVLLNAAGPSSEIHKRQPQYVFQTLPPYAAYADGPLWAAREAAVDSRDTAARDDAASRDMAEAAQTQARALGFANVTLEIYSGRTEDFLPQLYKAMGTNADGWIAFGEARDAAQMVKTLKRQGYVPKVLYARAAAEPRFVALVGQDAEFILGSKEYDARFSTAGNAEFVKAFTAKWSAPPGAACCLSSPGPSARSCDDPLVPFYAGQRASPGRESAVARRRRGDPRPRGLGRSQRQGAEPQSRARCAGQAAPMSALRARECARHAVLLCRSGR